MPFSTRDASDKCVEVLETGLVTLVTLVGFESFDYHVRLLRFVLTHSTRPPQVGCLL